MNRFFAKAALALSALMLFSCASTPKETVSADEAIVGVSVIGTIGMDGSKPRAIVVEYDRDLSGAKLDLNKPFEKAAEQITDSDHIWQKKKDGSAIYIPTGKRGSGTLGYNSGCTALGTDEVLLPGR